MSHLTCKAHGRRVVLTKNAVYHRNGLVPCGGILMRGGEELGYQREVRVGFRGSNHGEAWGRRLIEQIFGMGETAKKVTQALDDFQKGFEMPEEMRREQIKHLTIDLPRGYGKEAVARTVEEIARRNAFNE